MRENMLSAIRKQNMIRSGDTVIVALSGGADSVALFHLLWTCKCELGIRLAAAHFEHGLRGEASLNDADFVGRLCEEYDVALYIKHGDMTEKPKPKGESTEVWARRLRYEFFEEIAAEHGAKIATAHTKSDNAETVLLNMIRGSGPKGLGGIPPCRGVFVRPLLWVSRPEIERYCADNSLSYVTDETNFQDIYTRNILRNRVMPILQGINLGVEDVLSRMAQDMHSLDSYIEAQAKQLLADAKTVGGHSVSVLRDAPPPVQLKAMALIAPKGASRGTLARLLKLVQGDMRKVQLSQQLIALVKKGSLRIESAVISGKILQKLQLCEGEHTLWEGYSVRVSILSAQQAQLFLNQNNKKDLTFVADYGKILDSVFRTRLPRDTLRPPKRNITKPFRKWMSEENIPQSRRDTLPILAQGNRVVWVWGVGFCDGVQPDEGTTRWLLIHEVTSQKGGSTHE